MITLHDGYFVKPFACIDVYMEPFCYFINDNKWHFKRKLREPAIQGDTKMGMIHFPMCVTLIGLEGGGL